MSLDWLKSLAAKHGLQTKDPNTSTLMVREDAPGTYRVMCMECIQQFDVFGALAPATELEVSPVEQKLIEHVEACSGKRRPIASQILRNVNTPEMMLAKINWQP